MLRENQFDLVPDVVFLIRQQQEHNTSFKVMTSFILDTLMIFLSALNSDNMLLLLLLIPDSLLSYT